MAPVFSWEYIKDFLTMRNFKNGIVFLVNSAPLILEMIKKGSTSNCPVVLGRMYMPPILWPMLAPRVTFLQYFYPLSLNLLTFSLWERIVCLLESRALLRLCFLQGGSSYKALSLSGWWLLCESDMQALHPGVWVPRVCSVGPQDSWVCSLQGIDWRWKTGAPIWIRYKLYSLA